MTMSVTHNDVMVGVGLRHPHFTDILTQPKHVDFVEVHSENFFGEGGAQNSAANHHTRAGSNAPRLLTAH